MKDAANLVKTYAMVNVARYDIVATGATVTAAESEYVRLLGDRGIALPNSAAQTSISGVIEEIRTAVLDGNTYYFIRLRGESVFYSISAAEQNLVVVMNVGDRVSIRYASSDEERPSILTAYSITWEK